MVTDEDVIVLKIGVSSRLSNVSILSLRENVCDRCAIKDSYLSTSCAKVK